MNLVEYLFVGLIVLADVIAGPRKRQKPEPVPMPLPAPLRVDSACVPNEDALPPRRETHPVRAFGYGYFQRGSREQVAALQKRVHINETLRVAGRNLRQADRLTTWLV